MASPSTPLYNPYQSPAWPQNPVPYSNTTDPVGVAQNQRAWTAGQGGALLSQDEALADQYAQQASGTQSYLNPIEQNLAAGGGGYNPSETSQIELTPGQQQNIVTGAGISAGAGTASGVGAAERAAAAAGGNPAAMATYRARAAQTEGAQAGDAMTQARIAAQQAGSAGAQAVGNARINQQGQGAQYLGNLQSQQNTTAQNEQGLAQGAYGTQSNATGQATGQQVYAATLPTIADKLIGTGAGIASSLADGRGAMDYFDDDGMDAVVGEAGPEAIVEPPKNHMADGGVASSLWDSYINRQQPQNGATVTVGGQWSKATPYSQLGTAIGSILRPMLQHKTAKTSATSEPQGPPAPPNPNTQSAGPWVAPQLGTSRQYNTMPSDESTPMMADGFGFADNNGGTSFGADQSGQNDNGDNSDQPGKPDQTGTSTKVPTKLAGPGGGIQNYLNDAIAEALRPPSADPTFALQTTKNSSPITFKLPGGGGGKSPGNTPVVNPAPTTSSGMPPTVTSVPSPMPPVTTSWPPPSTPSTPSTPTTLNSPVRTTTGWPPAPTRPVAAIGGGGSTPASGSIPPGSVDETINYGDGNIPVPDNPPDAGGTPDSPPPDDGGTVGGDPVPPGAVDETINYGDGNIPVDNGTGAYPDNSGDDSGNDFGGLDTGSDWDLGDAEGQEFGADGLMGHMAEGGMRSGFRWGMRQPHQLHAPAGGYTPLDPRPRAMMASGGMNGFRARPSMPPAKVVTQPTRVKLAPGDKVVPLSFRAKAKIRPSAALPAMANGVQM